MTSHSPIVLDLLHLTEGALDANSEWCQTLSALEPGKSATLRTRVNPITLYPLLLRNPCKIHPIPARGKTWETTLTRSADPGLELDLRDLPPPAPLNHTMVALAELPSQSTLLIHTRFRPVFLLESLEQEAVEIHCTEVTPGHWQTRLSQIPISKDRTDSNSHE
ncbi:MAG: DUF2249 domain-containing protein [Puniceicoccaceae bacterium]